MRDVDNGMGDRLKSVPHSAPAVPHAAVSRSVAPKLGAYAGLTAFGLLAALVLGQPLVVALAVPFALVLGLGLVFGEDPGLEASVRLERERMLEQEEVALELELWAARGVSRLDILVRLPEGLVVA